MCVFHRQEMLYGEGMLASAGRKPTQEPGMERSPNIRRDTPDQAVDTRKFLTRMAL